MHQMLETLLLAKGSGSLGCLKRLTHSPPSYPPLQMFEVLATCTHLADMLPLLISVLPLVSVQRRILLLLQSMYLQFVRLAYQGKDIKSRFILEYSSLRDFGP
jgi:hypothetical protein